MRSRLSVMNNQYSEHTRPPEPGYLISHATIEAALRIHPERQP
jgi:hypothetical protein